MKLIDPSDDQLNAVFAEKVAGWRCYKEQRGEYALAVCYASDEKDPFDHWNEMTKAERRSRYTDISCIEAVKLGFFGRGLPRYTTSADAVLPFVIKQNVAEKWAAEIYIGAGACSVYFKKANAEADTLPRACVIALLRAHGVEIEFTRATP